MRTNYKKTRKPTFLTEASKEVEKEANNVVKTYEFLYDGRLGPVREMMESLEIMDDIMKDLRDDSVLGSLSTEDIKKIGDILRGLFENSERVGTKKNSVLASEYKRIVNK